MPLGRSSPWLLGGSPVPTFDVVRLNLHHSWFNLALFSSSVIIAQDGVVDHHYPGNNLHGAYGSMTRIVPRATLEPFVLGRVGPARLHLSENAGLGALNEATVGARIEGKLPVGFEYDSTMARQTGSLGADSIDTWAGHWNVTRQFDTPLNLKLFLEANYASDTHDPGGRKWTTFDQIYPSSHDKMDFADQVGWRNIEQVRGGVFETAAASGISTKPTKSSGWLAPATRFTRAAALPWLCLPPGRPAGTPAANSILDRVEMERDRRSRLRSWPLLHRAFSEPHHRRQRFHLPIRLSRPRIHAIEVARQVTAP